jgi:SAM-dependent methyltransferase
VPDPATRASLNAVEANRWDQRYTEHASAWGGAPNQWVAQICAELPPGTALDLACGQGRNALWLAGLGWTVTGVDFSQVALDRAVELARESGIPPERTHWVHADLLSYHPEPESVDLALLAYLHLPRQDRATVIRRAAEAVRPGGQLLVVAHHSDNLVEGIGGPPDPRLLYSAETAFGDVPAEAGFSVRRSERVLREVDGADRKAIDAVLLAVREQR